MTTATALASLMAGFIFLNRHLSKGVTFQEGQGLPAEVFADVPVENLSDIPYEDAQMPIAVNVSNRMGTANNLTHRANTVFGEHMIQTVKTMGLDISRHKGQPYPMPFTLNRGTSRVEPVNATKAAYAIYHDKGHNMPKSCVQPYGRIRGASDISDQLTPSTIYSGATKSYKQLQRDN